MPCERISPDCALCMPVGSFRSGVSTLVWWIWNTAAVIDVLLLGANLMPTSICLPLVGLNGWLLRSVPMVGLNDVE